MKREYKPGERVYVQYEGRNGTVVQDNGFGKNWDAGVDVKIDNDPDGYDSVSCAHDQLYDEVEQRFANLVVNTVESMLDQGLIERKEVNG